jgi:uroporphyrinogen III methyltransferase/synthase
MTLKGKRILITRARAQAGELAELLRARGAEPVIAPAIEIHPPPDPEPLRRAIAALASFDWVCFASANAVERTWEEMGRQNKGERAFDAVKIAVVGPATARALETRGVAVDLVAKEHTGDALGAELARQVAPGTRVLIPCALVASDALPAGLRAAGCDVTLAPAYETRPPAPADVAHVGAQLARGAIDAVTFASPSAVDHFCNLLAEQASALFARTRIVSIGPATTRACEKRDVAVAAEASPHTAEGMVEALQTLLRN